MNEMYNMSIDIHYYGVMIMLFMIVVNLLHVKMVDNISIYVVKMRFIMPAVYTVMSLVIFTGVVMMASKHLHFTIENIVMILFSITLIVLDAKRYSPLKRINPDNKEQFEIYRAKAVKILIFEIVATVIITAWMSIYSGI